MYLGMRLRTIVPLLTIAGSLAACGGRSPTAPSETGSTPPVTPPPAPAPPAEERATFDVDRLGIPQFITHNYIELAKIEDISRFRSGAGHDYSDSVESCRSMKHYFRPARSVDAATIRIYSPVEGEVISVTAEWAGVQIAIRPKSHPAFRVILFHVTPSIALAAGRGGRTAHRQPRR